MTIIFKNLHSSLQIPNTSKLNKWLINSLKEEGFSLGKLSYTFLTDEELHQMNVQFLKHDTLTDIITFDYNQAEMIIGEIYISLDRVEDNSKLNHSGFNQELYRVIIHGLLHLLGYKDKSESEKTEMTSKEDYYLSLRS